MQFGITYIPKLWLKDVQEATRLGSDFANGQRDKSRQKGFLRMSYLQKITDQCNQAIRWGGQTGSRTLCV